jgi:hypothetical protein
MERKPLPGSLGDEQGVWGPLLGVAVLAVVVVTPVAARQNQGSTPGRGDPPASHVTETPELGSLALFGTGAAGMAGYVLTRARGRRRQ